MREVRLRPKAAQDIEAIAVYTIERWGQNQAKRYISDLRRAIEGLARDGPRHALCYHIAPELRRARSGSHLIYFRVDEHAVEVVRVLHERMDVQGLQYSDGEKAE